MNICKKIVSPNNTGYDKSPLKQEQGNRLLWLVLLIGISALFIITAPASAGEQYMAGSPVLSASVAGTNEFSPGTEVQIAVVIENTGVNTVKFQKTGTIDRDDLPNTAKFLTVTLEPGNSPLIIKSDPQMLGDLKASNTATGKFTTRIPSDTPAGSYNLPVKLTYTYMYTAEQYGTDTIQYSYKTKDEVFEIPITIKPDVRINVVSADIQHMNAGTEGAIHLEIKNIGHEDAKKAIVIITRNDGSPVVPTQSSAYIGDFPSGGTATAIFKASVADSAEAQTYPLDVSVKYENREGDIVTSDIETIGIPVGSKIEFAIVSEPETVSPGQKKVITVRYKNTGGATAYKAQARVSMVDPFTSNDDSAYLGDIAPGETKEASFLVTVAGAATLKQYGIDSEIRYNDAFDNQIVSDPIKLGLNVAEDKGGVAGLLKNPLALAVIALVILGIGYALYRKKALQ
ncbi:MAG: S-layer protein [Methanomicrobiales archaeon HGW-Methanomicrobiales-5]|nr:MAG: S-layer protein [Methanomicrobiales archaeon HGW-Methanomicrobiales-5]